MALLLWMGEFNDGNWPAQQTTRDEGPTGS